MKTKPECINCIISDLWGAIKAEIRDEDTQYAIINKSLSFLGDSFSKDKVPSFFITQVHRIFKEVSGIRVPFKEIRQMSNQVGLMIARKVSSQAKKLKGFALFSYLVDWAIAGNYVDFRTVGTGYDFPVEELERRFLGCIKQGIQVDEKEKIYQRVKKAKKIVYIHDNVGEIALDKLLVSNLREYCPEVISAVRGGPITSDATREDAIQVGLKEAASRVILAGPDTLGISFEEMSKELKEDIEEADLIITKGQANFYVMSEESKRLKADVVCLFRTKCQVVSSIFGYKEEINLVTILEGSKPMS